jgi:hypothetical protein
VTQQIASGSCAASPPPGTELYQSCDEVTTIPSLCGLEAGMQTCSGSWTSLCQKDADCPNGTLCLSGRGVGDVPVGAFGTCAKTCATPGNVACGRCDLGCDTTIGVCTAYAPRYLCDASHPGIDVTVTFSGTGGSATFGQTFNLDLPGSGALSVNVSPTDQFVNGEMIIPYPAGTVAGPATIAFYGSGPGVINWDGSATFDADPTMCTKVTIVATSSGLPDAG